MLHNNPDGSVTPGVYDESTPLLQESLISVEGTYPNRTPFEVIGEANTINATRVDVTNIGNLGAGVVYAFPPAGGITMYAVSDSPLDAANGTGIRTLRMHSLNAEYVEVSLDLTMNGNTPVPTPAADVLRLNGVHALTCGNGAQAAGNITITDVTGNIVYARIEQGHNTSRNAVFTVPAGHQGYVNYMCASAGTLNGTHYTRFALRATTHDNALVPGIFMAHAGIGALNGGRSVTFPVPHRFPEKCDIKMSVVSDAANANALVGSEFSGRIES